MNITTELLLKRAQSKQDKMKVEVYHSKELDGDIEIRKIDLNKFYDLLDESDDSLSAQLRMNCSIIYECIPILHNDELISLYDCVEPYEIVTKVFNDNMGEITDILNIIMGMYGMSDSVASLKN